MYAQPPSDRVSHLLVRTADGQTHRVLSFRSFQCSEPITVDGGSCSESRGIPYHFADLVHYIQNHSGTGTEDAELITRTWQIRRGEAPEVAGDCVMATCKVSR